MTVAAGSRLGPYEVLSPLGAGGMGEVWRARDTRLEREVAIKVLPADVTSDRERVKRFEKEARSASALNHPNIVTIYDIGSSDSVSYIAMEKVDGKTLREILLAGALPVRRLLAIAAQTADGLAVAHRAGIVHRDLKPENLMVTRDGLVKILDFGLAKLTSTGLGSDEASRLPTETGTSPGAILGTVGYMSPEQAGAQPVDFRSDQFSFGSILYEMATGKRAFQKGSAIDTLSAILHEDPRPVAESNPEAPAPLRWIVERCLAKDPEGRYVSTRDLARDLATVRDRLSEASLSGAAPAVTPSTRPRTRAAVFASILLLALAAGAFGARPAWRKRALQQPTLRQITFRRAGIMFARFAPDGQILYGAFGPAVDPGKPFELFSTRPGTSEPRSLGLPAANIVSVSSSGELAVLGPEFTLSTVPLAGGAPREVVEKVRSADWSPDGKGLAVARIAEDGAARLEFPIGKLLYRPEEARWIAGVQFSPGGDRIAFREGGAHGVFGQSGVYLAVVDLSGRKQRIAEVPFESRWSPRGDEVWFNDVRGGATSIWGVTVSGRKRFVTSFPGDFVLQDVSRDGRILLERDIEETEIVGRFSGATAERNLSWLDRSVPAAISKDGKLLLFTETWQGGGPNGAVYKRGTDGSDAVRLGEGTALALSPDGLWALVLPAPASDHLTLLPTGPGQPRNIPLSGIRIFGSSASFFPDGKSILIRGAQSGLQMRLWALEIDSGRVRPVTPEGIPHQPGFSVSPDGRSVILSDGPGGSVLYDVASATGRPVPGLAPGLEAFAWCADGRSVFVRTSSTNPLKVYRLDLSSGRQELWKEFSVSDINNAQALKVIPTPDGQSYVYGYTRLFSDLFIAEGVK